MILLYRFCPWEWLWVKRFYFLKKKTFLIVAEQNKQDQKQMRGRKILVDSRRPQKVLTFHILLEQFEIQITRGQSGHFLCRWNTKCRNRLQKKKQDEQIIWRPKSNMTKSCPDQKCKIPNHLQTKKQNKQIIWTPNANETLPRKHIYTDQWSVTIFRAKNRPETSRSGRPCQCCKQEKCAEKVFLNDNLRMISWRGEKKPVKKKKGKRSFWGWLLNKRGKESWKGR